MKPLNRTAEQFVPSAILEMSREAGLAGAVNLAQGAPDFDPPRVLTDRLVQISRLGPHQYPPGAGTHRFRQALSEKYRRFMGWAPDPEEEICVTVGSTEAMTDTLFALTNQGDRIVLFSPFFENYTEQIRAAGCEAVFVPLVPPDYTFDLNRIEAEFKKGAQAILICDPSNPSGRVFTAEELRGVAELCVRYDVYAVTDEIYEHLVYDGRKHHFLINEPGMRERTVICSGLSKTFSITGWRLGYTVACPRLIRGIMQYHGVLTVGAASPLMEAAAAGLTLPDSYYEELAAGYERRRDLLAEGLAGIGIPFTRSQGTYFLLADLSEYKRPGQTDTEFCRELIHKLGVALVPGSSFFHEDVQGIVRLHFAKKEETLKEALNRLEGIRRLRG